MIMAFDFEAIRRDHPIEAVIAKTVKLRRAGKYQAGCCPFHPDRTPSFVVYEDSYHCFGCGAHGDVIDFVGAVQHLPTADAIAYLTGGAAPALTIEDRRALDLERERARLRREAEEAAASLGAKARWDAAVPVNGSTHPYLERKRVPPYGARIEGDNLLVPIYDAAGQILSVQAIPSAPGEKKMFHAGAPVKGGRYVIGTKTDGPIVICEGFATGATINLATGHTVVIAYSKTNIVTLAAEARERHPKRPLVIAADIDAIEAAFDVAERFAAKVIQPELMGAEGSDFNDQAAHFGVEDVARTFAKLDFTETPLPLVWLRDIQPLLNGNWIVKKVIPALGFVTIIGHPGCGKSFLALDLGLHIAAEMEWQGRKVKRGLVVYLAAEGQRGQFNRVDAWRRHHGIADLPFALIPIAINLRDREADLPKLIETIEAACAACGLPLAVLIVDTLNRTFGGGDENGEDMAQYVDNTGRLRAHFSATTIVVHHVPKNAETISERGHGSLRGAIDTSLAVLSDAESKVRTVRCIKQKDAEDGWEIQFKLESVELGHDEDGEAVTSCVVVAAENEMAAARTKGPWLSPTQNSVWRELLATLEVSPVSVPREIPDDIINRQRVGKVVSLSKWRERWVATCASDKEPDTARRTFDRSKIDLKNKGMVGIFGDHAWATHE